MPVHPDRERLDAAQRQPGVERARHRAGRVLHGRRAARRAPGSATTTAPPTTSEWPPRYLVVEWTTDVGAERQRVLQVGRGERVVHHQQRPGVPAQPARAPRCPRPTAAGWSASPPRPAAPGARPGPAGRPRGSVSGHRAVAQLPAGEDLVEQPVGAAVGVVRDEHVVTGLADGAQQAVLGGHAGGEGERPARRPPARRGTPPARPGSGSRSASTHSPPAARRPRPGRRWTPGRSAAPRPRSRGSGSCPAWIAGVSNPPGSSGPPGPLMPRSRPGRRARPGG